MGDRLDGRTMVYASLILALLALKAMYDGELPLSAVPVSVSRLLIPRGHRAVSTPPTPLVAYQPFAVLVAGLVTASNSLSAPRS